MATNPREHARRVLDAFWCGRGFPVDPAKIANEMGLDVFITYLPAKVSGALIKQRDQDPAIFLNGDDNKVRQRFSCGHELGHYIARQADQSDEYEYVDLRGEAASNGTHPDEIFANRFSAELLMPVDEVKKLHAEGNPSYIMAHYFGVSDDAMRFRLKNLGLR
ncbi:ImmA/IrrE family metallo-endopeptidase [Cronobacter sp. EKM101R]|uniref:ImmA/IrrE family metallo-endopeptidase n=1 Tax=Cronobacter TaxID=413496 RepID=UPI0013EA8549|nr:MULTISPECIES: ImmA/IrrE family metallo-endopeptidase [Cronobacter]KAF6589137.1 ImmA/IrrE family metallo-endopeptidase [Cronobacter sp. EKM101R]KAF6592393.1 ImmA/IrrE family metallo-endopeptidase [Cronobacter sp. EKM102R]MDK1186573.1 ImmA/IrrE family metallo-endopeptidase [Cronobacter turicensis]MDK1208236.1 ImmA/IrrE family metallo-endopeptidase [Cronobacter turicensis]MDK1216577.1 ImmA/IrrE family metallo-endopeptidase [Cronobacter turicensis]